MSDTPETDHAALLPKDGADWRDVVLVEFARKLERERDSYEDALRRIYVIASHGEDVWLNIEHIEAIAHNALNHHE